MAPMTSSTLWKVDELASLSCWYWEVPAGSTAPFRLHSTVVAGKPEEVQVSVKVTGEGVTRAKAMGELSCGEAESALCRYDSDRC